MSTSIFERPAFYLFLIATFLAAVLPLPAQTITNTVSTGNEPVNIAVNPVTNKIYVANFIDNTVTVVDGASDSAVNIVVGANPVAVAVNPATNKVYVVNAGSGNVTVIDGATNATTTTVAVGSSPYAVAVNPVTNKIYVSNHQSNNVTVIDGVTNATTTVVAGNSPYAVAVNPVTNKIYVTNQGSNNVTVIDGATNAPTTVTDSHAVAPVAVAVNPVTNKIYVVNQGSNNVTVIDGATNSTTTVNEVAFGVAVAVNPVTNKIYVVNGADARVTVIDGATNSAIWVGVGASPKGVAVNPVTNKIYVAGSISNNVAVIDGTTNVAFALADPLASGTGAVAVNPVTNKIYAANANSDNMTVITGASNSTTNVSAGTHPYDIAVNPVTNKIYVVNGGDNTVTVIDGATNSTTTVSAPNNNVYVPIAINQVTNKIYVLGSSAVTVIDGATNATQTVAILPGPNGLVGGGAIAVNPVTNKIYVSNFSGSSVMVIDGATNATTSISVGGAADPQYMAVNPVTNKVYVTNYNGGAITVIDGVTNAISNIVLGSDPGSIALNPVTNKIYATSLFGEGILTVIDGATNGVTRLTVPNGNNNNPHGVAVNPVTNKIYVACNGSVTTVIDGATNAITTISDPNANSAYAVTVNPVTNKVYVANYSSNNVTVIDGASNATTTINPGVGSPYFAAVDPITNKIYVANNNSNNVTVLTEQQVQSIPLNTAITPLANNETPGPTATFNFTASSSFTPTAPPPHAVYFQLDTWQTWLPTSGTAPNFTGTTPTLSAGTHILYAFATDGQDANSTGVAQQLTGSITAYPFTVVPVVSTPFPTTTSVTSNENPANPGDSVVFTATVNSQHFWPTGSVTFLDGTTTLGSVALTSGQATFTTTSLAAGTHSITASYGGDSTFASSTSAPLNEDVSTLQSITVSPGSSTVGVQQPQQFTATGHFADGHTEDLTTLVTWSSSNTSIASISNTAGSQGLGRGASAGGPVTITALSGAINGTAQLTVTLAPDVVSFSPSTGAGVTRTFTATVYEPVFNGFAPPVPDLNEVQLLFNTTPTRVSGCSVYYAFVANTLSLYTDNGGGFVGSVTPGSAAQVSNTQCTLSGVGSSIGSSGKYGPVTLNVALTFSGALAGQQNAYVYAQGNNGLDTGGWVLEGTWTVPSQPPMVASLSPNSGTGSTQAFTVVATDPSGLADLNQVQLLFNTAATRVSGCSVYYVPSTNTLSLYTDNGGGFVGSVTPGSATQVSNTQCTLSGTGSSFSVSGNTLTLTAALTFSGTFTGQKNSFVYVQGNNGLNNGGWTLKGTWTNPPAAPTVVSLTPSSGTGLTQTFAVLVSDPTGLADLNQVQLLFNTTASRLSGCNVFYSPSTNTMYLYTDDGSTLLPGVVPGLATQVSNSQCTLSGTGSSFSTSGNNLTLNVSLTFSGAFTGLKNAYVYVQGNDGLNNGGWSQKGSWTP